MTNRRQLNECAGKRKDILERVHEGGLKFLLPPWLRGIDIRLERFCLLWLLLSAKVSGEAAYEVSMMHFGAIGGEAISIIWLLHTHTTQSFSMLTLFSYHIVLFMSDAGHL